MSNLTRKDRYLDLSLEWNTSGEIICRLLVCFFVFFAAIMACLLTLGFADLSFPLFKNDSYWVDFCGLGVIGLVIGLIVAFFTTMPLIYSRRAKTLKFWIYFSIVINSIFYLVLVILILATLIKFHKIDIYFLIGIIGTVIAVPIVLSCLVFLKKEIKKQWLLRMSYEAKQDIKIIKATTNIVQALNE